MHALPDHIPQLWNPTSNIAGLGAAVAPPLNPNRRAYYAYDGTPIGYGNNCDPISMEPELSGMLIPDYLEDNRLTAGQEFAMPLAIGTLMYSSGASPLRTAGWTLAGYMAPMPVAAGLAILAVVGGAMGRAEGLGQHWGDEYRPGPWESEEQRKCVKLKRVWSKQRQKWERRCAQYARTGRRVPASPDARR